MTDILQRIIDLFPHHEPTLRELSGSDPGFDALCHEYGEVVEGLHALEGSEEADSESRVHTLEERRRAIADELREMVAANVRS